MREKTKRGEGEGESWRERERERDVRRLWFADPIRRMQTTKNHQRQSSTVHMVDHSKRLSNQIATKLTNTPLNLRHLVSRLQIHSPGIPHSRSCYYYTLCLVFTVPLAVPHNLKFKPSIHYKGSTFALCVSHADTGEPHIIIHSATMQSLFNVLNQQASFQLRVLNQQASFRRFRVGTSLRHSFPHALSACQKAVSCLPTGNIHQGFARIIMYACSRGFLLHRPAIAKFKPPTFYNNCTCKHMSNTHHHTHRHYAEFTNPVSPGYPGAIS